MRACAFQLRYCDRSVKASLRARRIEEGSLPWECSAERARPSTAHTSLARRPSLHLTHLSTRDRQPWPAPSRLPGSPRAARPPASSWLPRVSFGVFGSIRGSRGAPRAHSKGRRAIPSARGLWGLCARSLALGSRYPASETRHPRAAAPPRPQPACLPQPRQQVARLRALRAGQVGLECCPASLSPATPHIRCDNVLTFCLPAAVQPRASRRPPPVA